MTLQFRPLGTGTSTGSMPGAPPSLSHARSSGLAARRKGDPLGGFAPHPHPPTPRPRVRPAPATFRVASGAAPLPACLLDVHPEVAAALAAGEAVVALESTIISHGMPHPANVETAARVEAAVRAAGAVPATIAVLGGTATVGLTRAQLERLGRAGTAVRKASRRDLAAVAAAGADGSTTVAATALLAAAAGIQVFVTGGLGGVHRGGHLSLDVSADLAELARSRIAVVCAGPKTLLDIPRTLEVLETAGVGVAALGTNEFPAFFTPRSGCAAPLRVEDAAGFARMVLAQERLGLTSGLILGVLLGGRGYGMLGRGRSGGGGLGRKEMHRKECGG